MPNPLSFLLQPLRQLQAEEQRQREEQAAITARDNTLRTLSALPPLEQSLPGWTREHCAQRALPEPGDSLQHLAAAVSQDEAELSPSSGGGAAEWSLELPCVLRPAGSAKGLDLHLQLFQLRVGQPEDPGQRQQRGRGQTATDSAQLPLPAVLDRAAGLLLARLLFPGATSPALRLLTALHCASAVLRAGGLLLSAKERARLRRRLQDLRAQSPAADAAAHGVQQLGTTLLQYAEPAAALAAAAALWAYVHPSSEQIGQAVAALVPVLLGYNQTARACASGRLHEDEVEQAWHSQHKWAAQRVAHLLTELPDQPPLAGLVSGLEVLNICVGSTVAGSAFGGGEVLAPWGAGGDLSGVQFWGSVAFPGGGLQHRREPKAARGTAAGSAEEATVAAAAGPAAAGGLLEAEPVTPPLLPVDPNSPFASAELQVAAALRGVIDSPSEFCTLPLQPPALATTKDDGQPGEGWFSPRCDSGRRDSRELDAAAEAALREALAASGSGAATPGLSDFMHPSGWAAARELKGTGDTAPISPSSTACSDPSFLMPGRSRSSSESGDAMPTSPMAMPPLAQLPGPSAAALPAALPGPAPAEATAAPAPVGRLGQGAAVGAAQRGGGEEEAELQLYGRGDHLLEAPQQLSLATRAGLALRACQLLFFFAPFLLIGSWMLLAAAQVDAAARRRQERTAEAAGVPGAEPPVASPTAGWLRGVAFRMLLDACKRSGAAFIKWGQWSSTREDIFPEDFCRILSELHDRAPLHSLAQTRAIIKEALGQPLEEVFTSFEHQPLASGSIAQVYLAKLAVEGEGEQTVAVKVRHPRVAEHIWQDFQLLLPLAALTSRIRSLRSLNLSDSVSQFSHTMTAQADLRVEAAHLRRFYRNFAKVGGSVAVPRPFDGLCKEAVLVESYEPGMSVAHHIREPHPGNTQIVALGVDTYLKMLLQDNFVHTDLHPGNILVRTVPSQNGGEGRVQIVLLDFGLAEELTPRVRRHFISFLNMIAKGDGRRASEHLLQWSTNQRCPDTEALVADMEELFLRECDIHSPAGINLDRVMKSTLHLARKHEVSIDSNYAALVIGVCVIVGFASSLDPRVNLMDAAAPCFLYYNLTGKVNGRLYM